MNKREYRKFYIMAEVIANSNNKEEEKKTQPADNGYRQSKIYLLKSTSGKFRLWWFITQLLFYLKIIATFSPRKVYDIRVSRY